MPCHGNALAQMGCLGFFAAIYGRRVWVYMGPGRGDRSVVTAAPIRTGPWGTGLRVYLRQTDAVGSRGEGNLVITRAGSAALAGSCTDVSLACRVSDSYSCVAADTCR